MNIKKAMIGPGARVVWETWRWTAVMTSLARTGSAFLPRAIEVAPHQVPSIGNRKRLFEHARTKRLRWVAGRSIGGDWDLGAPPIEEHPAFYAFQRRFREGAPWEETEYWTTIVDDVNHRVPRIGCRSLPDVERKFRTFDQLWKVIGTTAYRSTGSLVTYRPWEEVLVGLARSGELQLIDGRHRLIMAHVKQVTLPVLLILRHELARKHDMASLGR